MVMNCEVCRRLLLTSESPARPGPEAEAHLADCAACRDWRNQLLRIEANLPLLPVPPSEAKGPLLDQILHGPVPAPGPVALPLPRRGWPRLARAGVGAAAAAVLIAAGILLGYFLSQPGHRVASDQQASRATAKTETRTAAEAPPPNFVGRLLECDLRLAEADNVGQRVESLADLAHQLSTETLALAHAADREDLDALARMYAQVVREGVVPRARSLAPAQRRPVLEPIRARLAQAERDMDRLAAQAGPQATAPLRDIADTARAGEAQLRALMRGDA